MSGPVLFDAFQVQLFLPNDADEATADAARAALDEPALLASVGQALQNLFATVPALAVLSVRVEW